MKSTTFALNAYNHDGLLLNLSGTRDADECIITRITAADSQIDLMKLVPDGVVSRLAERVDARLKIEARKHNDRARAELHIWAYEFRVAELAN